MVMQVSFGAIHAAFRLEELAQRHRAGIHFVDHLEHAGPGAQLAATELAIQHRPAREANGRQVTGGRTH